MKKVRIEHTLTEVACLARVIDAETDELLEAVVGVDLNLIAGEPVITGILTRHLQNEKGQVVWNREGELPECETYEEEVEIVYIDSFDQSQVANSE